MNIMNINVHQSQNCRALIGRQSWTRDDEVMWVMGILVNFTYFIKGAGLIFPGGPSLIPSH